MSEQHWANGAPETLEFVKGKIFYANVGDLERSVLDQMAEFERQRNASQAREAELREKLDDLTGEACAVVSKLAAAEARIKELELLATAKAISDAHPFRSEAEIELQRENAELTRKLAEQQALLRRQYECVPDKLLAESGEEELRKLLEESKLPDWVSAADALPAVGQRAILCINGVVQHEIYIMDAADKSDFHTEYFWSRPELEEGLEISPNQFWMRLPQPKEPKQ